MGRGLVGLGDAVCGEIGGVAAWYAWNARKLRATAAQLEQTMSAQRHTARELLLEEELLRQIADTIPGALMQYRLDLDGQDRAEFLSDGWEATFGFSADQLRDDIRLAWDQLPPEDVARLVSA